MQLSIPRQLFQRALFRFFGLAALEGMAVCFFMLWQFWRPDKTLSTIEMLLLATFLILSVGCGLGAIFAWRVPDNMERFVRRLHIEVWGISAAAASWGLLLVLWLIQLANPALWTISKSIVLLFLLALWTSLASIQGRLLFFGSADKTPGESPITGAVDEHLARKLSGAAAGTAFSAAVAGTTLYFLFSSSHYEKSWSGGALLASLVLYLTAIFLWLKQRRDSQPAPTEGDTPHTENFNPGFLIGGGLAALVIASLMKRYLPEFGSLPVVFSLMGTALLTPAVMMLVFGKDVGSPREASITKLTRLLRIIVTTGGVGSVTAAFLVDVPTAIRIEILLIGIFLLAAGIMGKAVFIQYRNLGLILMNTLVLFLLFDITIHLAGFPDRITGNKIENIYREEEIKPAELDIREIWLERELPYYYEQSWGQTYWDDLRQLEELGFRYKPFAVWEQFPFQSQTINMLDSGDIRKTTGAKCGPNAYRIFMFGGSTMWGLGSPDWGTIASYIQEQLNETRSEKFCVVNFGMNGYYSTQEGVALYLELLQGNIPDMVIFYDGVNEVYVPYLNGEPGLTHYDYARVASKLENNIQDGQDSNSLPEPLHEIPTVQTLQKVRTAIDISKLSNDIVHLYLENSKIMRALSETYDFKVRFFWGPPAIYAVDKPLSDLEKEFIAKTYQEEPETVYVVDLYRGVYEQVQNKGAEYPDFYFIADAFADDKETLYIDFCHVTPEGNQMIAGRIMEDISSDLPK